MLHEEFVRYSGMACCWVAVYSCVVGYIGTRLDEGKVGTRGSKLVSKKGRSNSSLW